MWCKKISDVFLRLLQLGIGNSDSTDSVLIPQLSAEDWGELQALAERQGLLAVVLDGLDYLIHRGISLDIPTMQKKMWIGQVIQNYENRYEQYRRAIAELAGFYNSHGFKMMILKGYACSLDWTKPEHRPSGDIDIWMFGMQKEVDAILAAEKNVHIDSSHHHHTVFKWHDFTVEDHYDFINVHARKSNVRLERVFKELGTDDSHFVEVYGERVYLPSANLHALFLIRHMVAHFAAAEITLRQVLDWAFFVEKHGGEVNWPWLESSLKEFGLNRFFDIVNAICIENLGFNFNLDAILNHGINEQLKTRVLGDILNPEFNEEQPKRLLPRMCFRYRRWQANGWKQRLCYNESRFSAFWSGVWNHLLKPSSI